MSNTYQPESLHPYIMNDRLKKATGSGGISNIPIASAETLGGIKVPADSGITIDGSGNAYVPKPIVYSTSKVDTGKKWIDGRPIYSKVFYIPALSATSSALTVNHNENIDIMTHLHGSAKNNTTGTNFPLPFVAEDNINSNIRVSVTTTQLSIANAIDRSMLSAHIEIEFIEPIAEENTEE